MMFEKLFCCVKKVAPNTGRRVTGSMVIAFVLVGSVMGSSLIGGAANGSSQSTASEASSYTCPNGKTLMASEVRTPEDVRAFVRCARDFIATKKDYSLNDFRTAFDQPQWLDPNGQGSYVFVNQDKNDGRQAIAQIHPYSESAEGQPIGRIFTSFGDYIRNAHWIINRWKLTSAEGYVYYEWDNPATGSKKAPKLSYELRHQARSVDTDDGFPGQPPSDNYLVGGGVYVPELDGPCKASDLNTNPSPEKLQDFVRCAALKYQNYKGSTNASDIINSKFFVAQHDNSTELRAGEVYVFVVDADTARTDWSAEYPRASAKGTQVDATPEWKDRMAEDDSTDAESEAVATGIANRNNLAVLKDFGEGFLYYNHQNPATQQIERKITYAQLIRDPNGKQVVIASGYYLSQAETLYPAYNCNQPTRRVQASQVETYDDLRAFVMQARCYVQTNGINKARREFKKTKWFSNNVYVFVSENKSTGPDSILKIYPREPSREDTGFDDFNDRHGNAYYPEVHRIANLMGQGWMYYNFSTPGASIIANPPKATYIATFEEGGRTYRIGAGLYPDVPGVCANITANTLKQYQTEAMAELSLRYSQANRPRRFINGRLVNQVDLASTGLRDRATKYLQVFVRCAAQKFEQSGTMEAAKVALVTGSNPAAEEDDLAARGVTGQWRSTFEYKRPSSIIGGKCSNPLFTTQEACTTPKTYLWAPNSQVSRENYCSDPQFTDKENCEAPRGLSITDTTTCFQERYWAQCNNPLVPDNDFDHIRVGMNFCVRRQKAIGACQHGAGITVPNNYLPFCASSPGLRGPGISKAECEKRGTWITGSCDGREDLLTEAECKAASGRAPGEWTHTRSTPKPLTLDGQFREAPIYTFLYDQKGKLVWGRNAGQHKRLLMHQALRQNREQQNDDAGAELNIDIDIDIDSEELAALLQQLGLAESNSRRAAPYSVTELEWGTGLQDARGGAGTRVGPRTKQNVLKRLDTFGEAFVYYKAEDYYAVLKPNPDQNSQLFPLLRVPKRSKSVQRNKRAFVKKVRLGGKVYYLGAGVYE